MKIIKCFSGAVLAIAMAAALVAIALRWEFFDWVVLYIAIDFLGMRIAIQTGVGFDDHGYTAFMLSRGLPLMVFGSVLLAVSPLVIGVLAGTRRGTEKSRGRWRPRIWTLRAVVALSALALATALHVYRIASRSDIEAGAAEIVVAYPVFVVAACTWGARRVRQARSAERLAAVQLASPGA